MSAPVQPRILGLILVWRFIPEVEEPSGGKRVQFK